jgi:hypothetical protein
VLTLSVSHEPLRATSEEQRLSYHRGAVTFETLKVRSHD